MSDDIVTSLREWAWHLENDRDIWDAQEVTKAADEIERLRTDRNRWLNSAAQFAEALWVDHTGQIQIDRHRMETAWRVYRDTQDA